MLSAAQELIRRGYNVVAFARPKSGIGGKTSQQDVQKVVPENNARKLHASTDSLLLLWLLSRLWTADLPRRTSRAQRSCLAASATQRP